MTILTGPAFEAGQATRYLPPRVQRMALDLLRGVRKDARSGKLTAGSYSGQVRKLHVEIEPFGAGEAALLAVEAAVRLQEEGATGDEANDADFWAGVAQDRAAGIVGPHPARYVSSSFK